MQAIAYIKIEPLCAAIGHICTRHNIFIYQAKNNMGTSGYNKKEESSIPQNNPSKPMDSKQEVARSNDHKIDQDFPGYPHYPAKEDVMDERSGNYRVDEDVEKIAANPNRSGVSQRFEPEQPGKKAPAPRAGEGNANADEDDVSDDELATLNSRDQEIGIPQNVTGEDLSSKRNLPGSNLEADARNANGEA